MEAGGHEADPARQGAFCTNAYADCTFIGAAAYPASTDDGPAVRLPPAGERNGGEATTAHVAPFVRPIPTRVITIRDKNLKTSYIDNLMRSKGLDERAIAKVRSSVRLYIDSFVKEKGVELDEGAYAVLTNLIIYLVEESSKDE